MDTILKCVLMDDELPSLSYLKLLCEQLPDIEVIRSFSDPVLLLKELPNLNFDFCILDIEMPGINGLEVSRKLQRRPVIFATAYKEYAVEAFDLEAVDYIRKPINKSRLIEAIRRVSQKIRLAEKSKEFVSILTDKGWLLLFFNTLLYVRTSEVDKRDKVAILENGDTLTLKNITFRKLASLITPEVFCQVNKRELIAIRLVQVYNREEITLSPHTHPLLPRVLKLGKPFRRAFITKVQVDT